MLLNIILAVYEIVYIHLCYIVIYKQFKTKNSSMVDENTENITYLKQLIHPDFRILPKLVISVNLMDVIFLRILINNLTCFSNISLIFSNNFFLRVYNPLFC